MDEKKLESTLHETMHTIGNALEAPDRLKTRVDFARKTQPVRRGIRTWKRSAIALAAVFAVVVTGAVAATSMAGLYGHSWADQKLSYAETVQKAGVALPERFANGFIFAHGNEVQWESRGDAGDTEGAWTEIDSNYEKNGVRLSLNVGPVQKAVQNAPAQQTLDAGGVTFGYSSYQNLLVPADYELTEAQKQAERDGEIVVSYGTDIVEQQLVQSVAWQNDGKQYNLLGFDTGLSADEMLAMAAETVDA